MLLFWSVWLTWIMDVTNTYEYRWPQLLTRHFSPRWPAMFIATVAFVLPVMDQIYLCQQCRHVGLYKMKAGVVAYEHLNDRFGAIFTRFARGFSPLWPTPGSSWQAALT